VKVVISVPTTPLIHFSRPSVVIAGLKSLMKSWSVEIGSSSPSTTIAETLNSSASAESKEPRVWRCVSVEIQPVVSTDRWSVAARSAGCPASTVRVLLATSYSPPRDTSKR
jgi:hypothetical protein